MKQKKGNDPYIVIGKVLAELTGKPTNHFGGANKARFIKQFGVTIDLDIGEGKGRRQYVSMEQYSKLIAKYGSPVAPVKNGDFPSDDKESLAELHLGALETKIDRLCDQVKGLTDSMNVFIKSANLMTERLDKVLKSLE